MAALRSGPAAALAALLAPPLLAVAGCAAGADREPRAATAPPGFSADTFTRAGLISGATEAGRRALPDGIQVDVGSRRECLRCAAGGTEQQPARRVATRRWWAEDDRLRAADDGCSAVLADGRFPHAHAVGDEPLRFRATFVAAPPGPRLQDAGRPWGFRRRNRARMRRPSPGRSGLTDEPAVVRSRPVAEGQTETLPPSDHRRDAAALT